MRPLAISIFVLTVAGLVGCSQPATRTEFIKKDAECLRCYCASNAISAETALLELNDYALQCQKEGVTGILYDEVFTRIYGRLYLVEEHLGKRQAAEAYLQQAIAHYRGSGGSPRQGGLPAQEIRDLILREANTGPQVAWQPR